MRLKGSIFLFQDCRDRDLMRAFRKQLSICSKDDKLTDILIATVNSPSERFWVTEKRAFDIIVKIRNGDNLDWMKQENKKEMFFEINNRVSIEMQKHPRISLKSAVENVIIQTAPKFYLTPKSAKVIIHKIKKKWRKKRQNGQR